MMRKIWTIKELLNVSTDYLKEKHIDSPRLTAEVLLAFQLNLNRVKLYLNLDLPLNESEVSGYRELIRRRIQREPLQYITGVQEFWSLDFPVDPGCLSPDRKPNCWLNRQKNEWNPWNRWTFLQDSGPGNRLRGTGGHSGQRDSRGPDMGHRHITGSN